ncbi:MAG: exodeoxyribonuclease V subunit alpha [Brevinematia bacterium]
MQPENRFIKKAMEEYDLPQFYSYLIEELTGLSEVKDDELIATLSAMCVYLHFGSICIKKNESFYRTLKNIGVERPEELASSFFENIERYKTIIGEVGEYKPLIYIKEREILYFQKFFENERTVREIINLRFNLETKKNSLLTDMLKQSLLNNKQLDELQKVAIFLGVTEPFLIISGGPGTGKTTIIKHIVKYLIELADYKPSEIAITTPTGKAAQRIKEIFENEKLLEEIEISTIHRLLKYNYATEKFFYNRENFLPHKHIILDEVSMVDIVLLRYFLEAISPETGLIIMGDKDQLPPVGAGAFISRLIPANFICRFSSELKGLVRDELIDEKSFNNKIVVLEKSFRNVESIISIAGRINSGDEDIEIEEIKRDELNHLFERESFISLYDYENYWNFKELVTFWISKQFPEGYFNLIKEIKQFSSYEKDMIEIKFSEIFNFIESKKILSPTNTGSYGCDKINELAKRYFAGWLETNRNIFEGLPIIINKNDYNLELFNGNVGVILRFKDGVKAVFKLEKLRIYSIDLIPSFDIAFAISVHKSQGSEYERVLFIIPEEFKSSILSRQIVYTAITRAKKGILIAGRRENLNYAVKNSMERESDI